MSRRTFFDAGGSGSGLSPTVLYEVDFTSQGNVGALTPGTVTIDGKDWSYVRDGAGAASVVATLTAADGLKVTSDPTVPSGGAFITLPLTEVGADEYLWRAHAVTVTALVEHNIPAQDSCTAAVGLMDGVDGTSWDHWSQGLYRTRVAGTQAWMPLQMRASSYVPAYGSTLYTGDLTLTVFSVVSRSMFSAALFIGDGTAYPDAPVLETELNDTAAAWPNAGAAPSPSDVSVFLRYYQGNAPSPALQTVKMKKLRVVAG